MKFLVDENIPMELIEELKNSGYDILRVDNFKKGLKDQNVLELAFKERRILITFDKDFGELAVKQKKKVTGVILLRIKPQSIQFLKERILLLFKQIRELEGKFIVLEENLNKMGSISGIFICVSLHDLVENCMVF